MPPTASSTGFDRVAYLYPLLERLVYRQRLQEGRLATLSPLAGCRRIVLVGEGNGRFLQRLLEHNTTAEVTVIESSPRMIACARKRLHPTQRTRVQWLCQCVLATTLPQAQADAIVTHYFFDLFPPEQQQQILRNLLPALRTGGSWLDAEFLPDGATPLTTLRNRVQLAASYRFLGRLCNLPVRTLHCPVPQFQNAGLVPETQRTLYGQIAIRLWRKAV